ncbi:arylesterase [Granulicella arctica]|uniref:arylesterase n=1 Tax=Granulicella arctica TaxID=940613 RepID=UPI0021E084BD|nr:arylesterase [Granulicella arctica]
MQRSVYSTILAAFVLLIGCHSKDTSSPSTETPAAPSSQPAVSTSKTAPVAPNDARPLLVCFGDSLTAGYGTDPGQSYPDYLQADLDAKGYHYRVVNEGVSGATSKDGVSRLPEIVALKAAVIVVEFGGNDGLRGLPVKDMRANLDRIVSTLKASGARLAVAGITLPPDYGPDYVNQFTATYPLLAKKYQVPVYPFLLQGVFGVDGMMQADRTHATAKGNEIVARNLLPVVEPLLSK